MEIKTNEILMTILFSKLQFVFLYALRVLKLEMYKEPSNTKERLVLEHLRDRVMFHIMRVA